MRFRTLVIVFVVTGFLFLLFNPFAVYDCDMKCTRCLYYEQHIEPRFLGIPLWNYATNSREDKYSALYADIFGHPCKHLLKKAGFSYRGACGVTAEGALFQWRDAALKSLYEAYLRTHDRQLAQDTFTLIENLFPEQTTVQAYYAKAHHGFKDYGPAVLSRLSFSLDLVESSEEWSQLYSSAQQGFTTEPPFADNAVSLRMKKLSSPSEIVRRDAATALRGLEGRDRSR